MKFRDVDIDGVTFRFQVPPTTRDVLEYEVGILLCEGTVADRLQDMAFWAAAFVVAPAHVAQAPDALLEHLGHERLRTLCEAIVDAARVPEPVLVDLRKTLDRLDKIEPRWKPELVCGCMLCRGKATNPPGVKCKFDGLNPLGVNAVALLVGASDLDAPFYVTQLRAERELADGRARAFRASERDHRNDYHAATEDLIHG